MEKVDVSVIENVKIMTFDSVSIYSKAAQHRPVNQSKVTEIKQLNLTHQNQSADLFKGQFVHIKFMLFVRLHRKTRSDADSCQLQPLCQGQSNVKP